jgi:hypothetical protein
MDPSKNTIEGEELVEKEWLSERRCMRVGRFWRRWCGMESA